ncbi:MAG: YraN family protein, partial [Chloroflexi bacterium]|nr:YraN family protein [Chloroflexota bacterium]
MNNKIPDHRKKTGAWGEKLAAEYLEARGVEILEHNIHTPYGEIDLIGMDNDQLVFIEVRTLKSKRFGDPEVSINPKKQNHMINSALHYLQERNLLDHEWRIDVVALYALPANPIEY